MRLSKKTRSLVVAIMTLSLVVPSAALAGGGHSYGYGDGHSSGHGKGHGKGYGKGRNHGHYKKSYYKHHGGGHYNGGHYGKHVTKYKYKYKYDNDDDGENLLIGLLVGGLVGYAVGDARNSGSHQEYYAPAAAPQEVYPTTQYSYGDGTCLQEREYTNKVIVGGKTVDAYGTACLQPDGSWRYGPARLASF